MNHTRPLIIVAFLIFSLDSNCQVSSSDSSLLSEKAVLFKKELSKYLSEKAVYPRQAVEKHTWGDVILSCELSKEGKFSEPLIRRSPDLLLSSSSIVTLNYLDEKNNPEMLQYITAGREYLFVFRYRVFMNVLPVDEKPRAMKLFNETKYDKAMRLFDKAIKENEFDYELYSFRAKCKESLGDEAGAVQDYAQAEKLRNEIMAVVDVFTVGRTVTRTYGEKIIIVPVR